MVIWAKTDAGRAEMQARGLVKERAQRNLLLVIDGRKSDDMLLAQLAGISPQDFADLEALGLIAPTAGAGAPDAAGANGATTPGLLAATASGAAASSPGAGVPSPAAGAPPSAPASAAPAPLDYAQFTAALTRLIAKELGLRGFMLTLAVEKASSPQDLLAVAERAIDQIRDRRGEASAAAASQALFGG